MVRTSRLLLVLAALGGATQLSAVHAQAPTVPPTADPLPGLPHPPDQPRSLFQPEPAAWPYACAPLPGPYFEHDPLLPPAPLPQSGWFAAAEFDVVGVHLRNQVNGPATVGARPADFITLPAASLDWTVAPRLEAGYRLPSAFGEFALSYRFLATQGAETAQVLDGAAALRSRVDFGQIDADYASEEMSLWPHWEMKWRVGLRVVYLYFDSKADEPFAVAAAGGGVFEQQTTNRFWGVGPHVGLELWRRLEGTGLTLGGRLDLSTDLGRIQQGFFERSPTLGADGQPLHGETRFNGGQDVPILKLEVGGRWEPSAWPGVRAFAGYTFEHWWNAGRLNVLDSRGELTDQGIVLRAEYDF
jgi:hypothetical protein